MSARFSFALASILVVVGCSSETESPAQTPADAGRDATTDTGSPDGAVTDTGAPGTETGPGDSATEDAAGIKCGSAVCPIGESCCATGDPDAGFNLSCASSCPDGGAEMKCDGPEDCPAGASICCAEVDIIGSLPSCSFKTGVAECRNTCASNVPMSCPGEARVRRCQKPSDCTEPGYAKCCEFESGGVTATFCAPPFMEIFSAGCM